MMTTAPKKKYFETDEFKKLNSTWRKKLKESGFVDIESENDIEHNSIHNQEFTLNPLYIQYNQLCQKYLTSGAITDPINVFIFEKHCEGISNVKISELATEAFGKFGRSFVTSTIKRRISNMLKCAGIDSVTFNV